METATLGWRHDGFMVGHLRMEGEHVRMLGKTDPLPQCAMMDSKKWTASFSQNF